MNEHCALVIDLLRRLGAGLATAESLTGGGIGAEITAVPGASDVYRGGVISYSAETKATLAGVEPTLLACFGPVSSEVAAAMAEGAARACDADFAVSATGVAGPTGQDGHPVGTVWVGITTPERTLTRRFCFLGDRAAIREQTIVAAWAWMAELSCSLGE